jgi:hypothetical protein
MEGSRGRMPLINQPFNGQLGEILKTKLKENYNRLTILAAFAKNSGVLRMKPALESFKASGGNIQIFVGVDMQGTSYEALQNLLPLCDALYVVHSEDSATTFHSKVYLLENDTYIWMAVGSNNLTGGGLWTNFESCQCKDCTVGTPEYDELHTPFAALLENYMDSDYDCSRSIENEDDIIELENEGYIIREVKQRIEQNEERARRARTRRNTLFGRQRRSNLPRIQGGEPTPPPAGGHVQVRRGVTVQSAHVIEATDASEHIWFETRKLTGGSRNILDLSKLGKIISGNGIGSRYETDNPNFILGGVAFFDIQPEDTTVIKDVIVNYNGDDYSMCTIKFTDGNGSWRIQLKGENSDGVKIHLINGNGWLVEKILVFEKIRTDYYSLSVLESEDLQSCRDASYVVAHNGLGNSSKEYGLLL